MTSRCADCRFWNRNGEPWQTTAVEENDWEPLRSDKQKCLNVLHANLYGAAAETAVAAPAIVTDGSGYAASFWTSPGFGCTSFEPYGGSKDDASK